MEVEREVGRRQNLATQLRKLLESQLEVGSDTNQPLSEVSLPVRGPDEMSVYSPGPQTKSPARRHFNRSFPKEKQTQLRNSYKNITQLKKNLKLS